MIKVYNRFKCLVLLSLGLIVGSPACWGNEAFNDSSVSLTRKAEDPSNKKFIVMVEFGFSVANPYRNLIEGTDKCKLFSATPGDTEYSWHGDKVYAQLKSGPSNFEILPIKWGVNENPDKYFAIFDCIEALSKTFEIVGVNFSTSWINKIRKDLSNSEQKYYGHLEEKVSEKISNFLRIHPEIIIAMAAGNDSLRIEEMVSIPQSSVCGRRQPENLVCVSAYSVESFRTSPSSSELKNYVNIGAQYYFFTDQPDGTQARPFPILGRFSDQGNFVVLPAKEIVTSFLSPWYLVRVLSQHLEVQQGFGVSTDISSKQLKAFPIRFLDGDPIL